MKSPIKNLTLSAMTNGAGQVKGTSVHGHYGSIGVYRVDGKNLEFIEKVTGGLSENNVQGIVAI